jgi:hypothetical protein
VWSAENSVLCAWRFSDGTWTERTALLSGQVLAAGDISVHASSAGRWVVTSMIGLFGEHYDQLWVFSYGFPPSSIGERPVIVAPTVAIFPNPLNSTTQIEFTLPSTQRVSLRLYDVLGREVAVMMNEIQTAGKHRLAFDAAGLASGVYWCRLEAGGMIQTRKIVLLK